MMLGEDIFCSRSLLIIYSMVGVVLPSSLSADVSQYLMAVYYHHMAGDYGSNSRAWVLTSLALRMAQSVSSCFYTRI